jgi:putative FmdB family regulatory protein
MPMYEFTCQRCGADFEELCSVTEADSGKVECPECGAKKSKKQMSTFAAGGNASGGGGPACGPSGFG